MFIKFIQLLILFSIFGVFEIIYPAESKHTIKGKFRNVFYSALLLFVGGSLTALILIYLPFQPRSITFSNNYQLFGMVFLYLFIFDFFFYWYHRAEHHFAILWPIHELHHSDTELNTTSSQRSYWLEQPFQSIFIFYPMLFLLGYNVKALFIFSIALIVILVFSHSNLKLELGRWTPFICGPQLHRIHHSLNPNHHTKNFAQIFPVIDMVFGTYYKPAVNEFPETGTEKMTSNEDILMVISKPFRTWIKMIRATLNLLSK